MCGTTGTVALHTTIGENWGFFLHKISLHSYRVNVLDRVKINTVSLSCNKYYFISYIKEQNLSSNSVSIFVKGGQIEFSV